MARIFVVDEREFPDPDPSLTPDQVRESLVPFFPELSNAEVVPAVKRGDDEIIELKRRVGTKGGHHGL